MNRTRDEFIHGPDVPPDPTCDLCVAVAHRCLICDEWLHHGELWCGPCLKSALRCFA